MYSDYVPFVKAEKDFSNHKLELPQLKSVPKARSPSPLPDLTDEEIKVIENATEDELVEVAGEHPGWNCIVSNCLLACVLAFLLACLLSSFHAYLLTCLLALSLACFSTSCLACLLTCFLS